MATYTPNLNLKKPSMGEKYDVVADLNDAMDKLDIESGIVQAQVIDAQTKANIASQKSDAMASGSPKGVYSTLALLQAAYPTGTTGAYLVTADGKWYYWSGTAWTAGGIYQSAGLPSTVFDTIPSRNLYNPALATDGQLCLYSTGLYTAFATGASMGKMPVVPGKTYTISIPATESGIENLFRCYNSALDFIGNSSPQSTNPVASGITVSTSTANGRKQVTFTIAVGSLIAYVDTSIIYPYATHNTTDFDRIRNSIQFEEGAMFTKFESYGSTRVELKTASLPEVYGSVLTDIENLKQGKVKVIINGEYLYVRTPWDTSNDLIQRMLFKTTSGYTENKLIEFYNIGIIPKATLDSNVPFINMTTLKNTYDDITPANYNGTFIGANHGANFAINILKTAHGKTVQDVGSEWVDSSGVKFYIIRIVDANNIWVLSENIAVDGTWLFDQSIATTTLTHSSGATNTGTITFTTQTVTQIYTSIKNEVRKILLDGDIEISLDGVYSCKELQIVNAYDIVSASALLAYIRANVGGSVQPAFDDASIASDARMTVTYTYQDNGACVVNHSIRTYNKIKLSYIGFIQAMANIIPAGGTLHEYIPKTKSFIVGANTYDFKNVRDITALADSVELVKANWEMADNPPERFIQFAKTSGGLKNSNFGFTLGYCPEVGIGKPAIRKDLINSAFNLHSSKKQYPKGLSTVNTKYPDGLIPANTNFDMVAFRCPINYGYDSTATNISWYKVGADIYLMLDYHANVDKILALPISMLNKKITVVEKTASFTVDSEYVSYDGIKIAVTGGYGYAILKLS